MTDDDNWSFVIIRIRDVKRRLNFRASNYVFEFDNCFHLALTLEVKCCWHVISAND